MPRTVSVPAFINHPELRPEEIFLANLQNPNSVSYTSSWDSPSGLARYPWMTRRVGTNAISGLGGPVPNHQPVFCDRKELEGFGINPNTIW